jgi:hypothetical protein
MDAGGTEAGAAPFALSLCRGRKQASPTGRWVKAGAVEGIAVFPLVIRAGSPKSYNPAQLFPYKSKKAAAWFRISSPP